jgi:hypothetical protein
VKLKVFSKRRKKLLGLVNVFPFNSIIIYCCVYNLIKKKEKIGYELAILSQLFLIRMSLSKPIIIVIIILTIIIYTKKCWGHFFVKHRCTVFVMIN